MNYKVFNSKFTKKYKKNKSKVEHSVIMFVVTLTVLSIAATTSKVVANTLSNIPVIGSVFRVFGDRGLKLASENGVSSLVGQTKVDRDIKVTISDVLYDGTRISIGYVMEGKKVGEVVKPKLLVNGKLINFSMFNNQSSITKDTHAGVINVNPANELPKDSKLSVLFNKIGTIEGNWKFEDISVKRQDYMLNCKVITPMITKPILKGNVTIAKMIISDSIIKITAIESNLPKDIFYQYQLMDNYGNILKSISGNGYGREGTQKTEFTFESLHNNPKSFVIKVLGKRIKVGKNELKDIADIQSVLEFEIR